MFIHLQKTPFASHMLSLAYLSKNLDNSSMIFFNLSVFILASIFIIVLAYITTRFLSSTLKLTNNKNIKLIEKLQLGVDKSLAIIKIDKHFYLISISKNSINLIDRLDSLEIKETTNKNLKFDDILSRIRNKDK